MAEQNEELPPADDEPQESQEAEDQGDENPDDDEDEEEAEENTGKGGIPKNLMSSVEATPEMLKEFVAKDLYSKPYASDFAEETENEVKNMGFKSQRPLLNLRITKKRKEFGSITAKFSDQDNPQPYEWRTQKDPNHKEENYRRVCEIGLQAGCRIKIIPQVKGQGFQAEYTRSVNATTKYKDSDYLEEFQKNFVIPEDPTEPTDLEPFVRNVEERVEEALQSNEIIDVFADEFTLGQDDTGAGGRPSDHIRETRAFHNLKYTKNKVLSDVQWITDKEELMLAASCTENIDFDERVKRSGRNDVGSIIVWTFAEYANVQYILKAPLEITKFTFSQLGKSRYVAAGLLSGQIILYDTHEIYERKHNDPMNILEEAPMLEPCAVSGINDSHKQPVVGLAWLPNRVLIERKNLCKVLDNDEKPHQFASLSEDGYIMFWDIIFPPDKKAQDKGSKEILWVPLHRFQLTRPEASTLKGGAHLLFHSKQLDSQFYVASDEGELMKADWIARTMDEAKPEYVKTIYSSEISYRAIVDFRRSPFYDDILLTVHDFNFCIWKEGCETPIFSSAYSQQYITCGAFSPTRPAVVMIGRRDGYLDVWDFLDQSHKESLTHHVTTDQRITVMRFLEQESNQPQRLALGDSAGNVHILEVPTSLSKKHNKERHTMYAFWEREEQRIEYYKERFVIRQEEAQKREMEAMRDDNY